MTATTATAPTAVTGRPHAALRGTVLRYEGYAENTGVPVTFRELPCTFVPIIIDLAAGWTISHARTDSFSPVRLNSFVAGITEGSVLVGHDGTAQCLQIDLTPLGARRLLRTPMDELANRTVPLEDVLGRFARDLGQRIGNVPDWPGRFALLDQALMVRLDGAPPIDDGVAWSLHRIRSTGGAAAIGGLAADLGWSHRRLISRYRDAVGLPPKLVARIMRFELLTARVSDATLNDWAQLAADCGYFDQAHLARDVRELAGITPTELAAGG